MVTMYQFGVFMGYYKLNDVIPRMQRAVDNALLLDEQNSSSQMALGILDQVRWDWDGAERAFRRALEISPGDAQIYYSYCNVLILLGRFDEAIERMKRAYEMDLQSIPWLLVASCYMNARRFDEAIPGRRGFPPTISGRSGVAADPRILRTHRRGCAIVPMSIWKGLCKCPPMTDTSW